MVLAGQIDVLVDEHLRQMCVAQSLEVHREKGEVEEHIAEPESLVELQAIKKSWTVFQTVDIVG